MIPSRLLVRVIHFKRPLLLQDAIFIAGYNLSGGVAGYSGLGSGGDDQSDIACDATGNVFVCSDIVTSLFIGPDTLKSS